MSDKCGAGKSSAPTAQASSWRGIPQSTKSRIRYIQSGGGEKSRPQKAMSDPNLSAPVYFLVREQAKSVVAIKELQEQMRSIEEFKTDVICALCDIQHHLSSENVPNHSYGNMDPTNVPSMPEPYTSCSYPTDPVMPVEKYVVTRATQTPYSSTYKSPAPLSASPPSSHATVCRKLELNSCSTSQPSHAHCGVGSKQFMHSAAVQTSLQCDATIAKDPKDVTSADSDKQDSGLDSDCRDTSHGPLSLSGAPRETSDYPMDQSFASKDELLYLLDAIGQRGIVLKAKADELERIKQQKVLQGERNDVPDYLEFLEKERSTLNDKLAEAERDRDDVKKQLMLQERTSGELSKDLKDMEYKLRLMVLEKQNMEHLVQDMKLQLNNESAHGKADSWPGGDVHLNKHLLRDDNSTDAFLRKLNMLRSQQGLGASSSQLGAEGHELQNLMAHVLQLEDPASRFGGLGLDIGFGANRPSTSQSHNTFSSVNKTSVLDILCLVGFYRMENSVLQNKVLRLESSLLEQNKQEEKLRKELTELKKDKEQLAAKLEENKCEQAALLSKVTMLEKALNNVCQESCTGLTTTGFNGGKMMGTNLPFHLLQPSANAMQTHSLPPLHHWYQNDPFHLQANSTNFLNMGSPNFTTEQANQIRHNKFSSPGHNSLNDSFEFHQTVGVKEQRSSTPVTMTPILNSTMNESRWESQNRLNRGNSVTSSVRKHISPSYKVTEGSRDIRLSDWETDSDMSQLSNVNDSFLVEGQIVGNQEVDMDSIRSEFDPLTKEDSNRMQDFVDSLDIPIKTSTVSARINSYEKNVNNTKKISSQSESYRYCGIPRPSVGRVLDASSFKMNGSKKQSNIRHIQNFLGRVGADKEPLL